MISRTNLLKPRSLFILLGVAAILACMWFVMRAWHAESHQVEMYVRGALTDYGPLLLFLLLMASGVGVSLGEDVFIIPAGYLMGQGIMPMGWTILAAYLGVIMADTLWLLVCKTLSRRILNIRMFRRLMHPRRILEIKYQFEQYGVWVVVVSRFIPASRTTVITAAGIARMSTWKFLLAETLSAVPTVITQLGIGWLAAKAIGTGPEARHVRLAITIGLGVLLVVGLFWWWRRSRRAEGPRPRARMSWLLEATGRRVPSQEH